MNKQVGKARVGTMLYKYLARKKTAVAFTTVYKKNLGKTQNKKAKIGRTRLLK